MFGINHYATTYGRACQPVESPDGRSCKYDCSCTVTPSKPDCAAQQGVPDLVSTDDVMSSATVATGSGRLPQVLAFPWHPPNHSQHSGLDEPGVLGTQQSPLIQSVVDRQIGFGSVSCQ